MKTLTTLSIALFIILAFEGAVRADWTKLEKQPQFYASTALLLTDGRVLCLDDNSVNWWYLVPKNGSYHAGTWKPAPTMKYPRQYFASAVLSNGNVVVAGGENSGSLTDINNVELLNDSGWTEIAKPVDPYGFDWFRIGDAPCAVLQDGSFLLGNIFYGWSAKLDPVSLTWSSTGFMVNAGLGNNAEEESWTLLPDGDVLTADCLFHPNAEYFYPALGDWFSAGTTTEGGGGDPVESASTEIGPSILLPNGNVVVFGATGFNAYFDSSTYTWSPARNSPNVSVTTPPYTLPLGIKDGPACLLPNGKVLCAMAPVDGVYSHYLGPTTWELFDYTTNSFKKISAPATAYPTLAPYYWRLLMLPTGQVLATNGGNEAFLYTSAHVFPDAWRPTITSCPTIVYQGLDYSITGTQFNGLSQANAYGDDSSNATNYPLVRIKNLGSGQTVYCRTHDHSTMAVATGSLPTSTNFTVPLTAESGWAHLVVIANGIESEPATVLIKRSKGR